MPQQFLDAGQYNVTSTSKLIDYSNYLTGYWFGPFILIALFCVIVIIRIGKDEKQSTPFVVASFITTIVAVFFRAGQWVNDTHVYMSLGITILAFAWAWFENK